MPLSSRYYPLIDEIKYHVFNWATDPEWKRIPPKVSLALSSVMTELRVYEALKSAGEKDDDLADDLKSKKKTFIALFKKYYLELTDMKFDAPITPVNQINITRTIENLEQEGAEISEFVEWFFRDYCSLEENKKFMPPAINFMCNKNVVNKYLFKMKDELRMRKDNMRFVAVRNAILEIAMPFSKRIADKDFVRKMVDFNDQKITVSKFFDLLKKYAAKYNDAEAISKCRNLEASNASPAGN